MLNDEQRLFAIAKFKEWAELAKMEGLSCQIDHSSTIHRLLSGGAIFDEPPPKYLSRPCHEMIDGVEIETFDPHTREDGSVIVAGDGNWRWETVDSVLRYGKKWRFSFTRGNSDNPFCKIKRIEDAKEGA